MSLWLLKTVAPCMSYADNGACYQHTPPLWGPDGLIYNGSLVTCPRHYKQTTQSVSHFFFAPGAGPKGEDYLRAIVSFKTTYWPGWDVQRIDFDAESGQQVGQDWVGIWGQAWTGKATLGSYNAIYACMNSSTVINQVSSATVEPISGGWSVNPYNWNPKSIYFMAVVNRQDNLLAAVISWTLDCWRNIGTTPERFAQMRLPNTLGYMAYESRNYCWIITKDGVILKADYQVPRWEMISRVNKPEVTATDFLITFDTRRKRVVVFRVRPDAEDGACRHQLEFYYPMVSPAQLTKPVPVTSLRANQRIILVAHLIGEAGEGVTPYTVNGKMALPVEGRLITPFSGTELNGRVCFQYQAPDQACEETLQLDVTVEES